MGCDNRSVKKFLSKPLIWKKHSINGGCVRCWHLISNQINLKEHGVGVHEEIFVWKKGYAQKKHAGKKA